MFNQSKHRTIQLPRIPITITLHLFYHKFLVFFEVVRVEGVVLLIVIHWPLALLQIWTISRTNTLLITYHNNVTLYFILKTFLSSRIRWTMTSLSRRHSFWDSILTMSLIHCSTVVLTIFLHTINRVNPNVLYNYFFFVKKRKSLHVLFVFIPIHLRCVPEYIIF